MNNNNKLLNYIKNHKVPSITILCCVIVVLFVVGISGMSRTSSNNPNETKTAETTTIDSEEVNTSSATTVNAEEETSNAMADASSTEEDPYLDALRKCTVMEAADIYTTGIGKKSDNSFNDARETCEGWYLDWGEDDFYDAVYADWENRKTEEIEGEPLTYYLDILGW